MKKYLLSIIIMVILLMMAGCVHAETATVTGNNSPAEIATVDEINESELSPGEIAYIPNEVEQPQVAASIPAGSVVPAAISFLTLEDFLEAHRAARFEGDVSHIDALFWGASDLESAIVQANLASLERLHWPSIIPEDYHFFEVSICSDSVVIIFVPEDYVGQVWCWSMDARSFTITVPRCDEDVDVQMAGAIRQHRRNHPDFTYDDLIEGKYLYYNGVLRWGVGNDLLILPPPVSPFVRFGAEPDPTEIIQYAAVETINLFDNIAVDELLTELRAVD